MAQYIAPDAVWASRRTRHAELLLAAAHTCTRDPCHTPTQSIVWNPRRMPTGIKRALIGLMAALTCYCLIGFLILPGVAQRIINQQLVQYATVPARLERIEFNPFTLKLTLFNLHLGE